MEAWTLDVFPSGRAYETKLFILSYERAYEIRKVAVDVLSCSRVT